MKSGVFLTVSLMMLIPISPTESIELSGYYKNFSVVLDPIENPCAIQCSAQNLTAFSNNRIRLNFDLFLAEWMSFRAAYDFSPRIQDRSYSEDLYATASIDPSSYRALDLDSRLFPSEKENVKSFALHQNLDRAVLILNSDATDIYIGRQAIAWGSAHAINPTDIIAPFTFNELDAEDRYGVDALRIRIPTGPMGEVDCGYVFGKEFEFNRSAFFLRSKQYISRTDVSALLLGFRNNLLVGLDITRSIGGAGAWMEMAHVFVDALDKNDVERSEDYFRGTIGCDYSFSGKVYSFIEYHMNLAGARDPEIYSGQLAKSSYTEGAVYLLGRHYLVPGLTLLITPILKLDMQTLFNLTDPSMLLAPIAEYNIKENFYISGGAFIGIGKGPDYTTGGATLPTLGFGSEFGGYPDIYFASLRVYF